MKARISLLVLLALVLPVQADWKRVDLAGGSVCQDSVSGAQFKPPYAAKADVSKACNVLTSFVPWLGTADAQTLTSGIFSHVFPTGINVGSAPPPVQALSSPWLQIDIGSPPVAGTAFDAVNVLTIQGSGDFHKDTSAFHFVYQGKTGNWRIDFPLQTLTGSDQYRSCGPAILDSLGADVKYTYLSPSLATGKAIFGGRPTSGAGVYETQTLSAADFSTGILRIEKIGSTQTGYISTDGGMTFTQVGSTTWTPAGTFYIGIHDDSGVGTTLSTCTGLMPTLTSLSSSGPGVLQFTDANGAVAATSSAAENAGTVSKPCLTRSVDTSGAISGDIQNPGTGSAVAGTDFTNPPYPQTLSWANGEGGTKCGSVALLNRAGNQPSRTINYTLGNLAGGVTAGAQATHTLTITDSNLVAIKFQPGWYGLYDTTCAHNPTVQTNCATSAILSTIATEICPNANLTGLKLSSAPAYLIPDTANVGNYAGDANQGFGAIDQILAALQQCGKYLMLETQAGWFGGFGSLHDIFPSFTYPASGCGIYNCTGGTGTSTNYGVLNNTQASQPGLTAKIWQTDWRDLAIATAAAYCARYDSNPAFYSFSAIYYNTSLPFALPYPSGYTESAFHTNYHGYLTGARSGCATTNLPETLDFTDSFAAASADVVTLQSMKGSIANNDFILSSATTGQRIYTGNLGDPAPIDYRGVVRYMEQVETPDMCGSAQTLTPTQIFDVMQNGNAGNLARWPNTIVITMATECPDPYGWASWKTFIAGKSGQVMDARGPTLRTPAYVKANSCESSQVCQ